MAGASAKCHSIWNNPERVKTSIGSDRGGIGIVHQVLVLACESRTSISEVRSGVGVKRRCLNEAGMD